VACHEQGGQSRGDVWPGASLASRARGGTDKGMASMFEPDNANCAAT